MQVKGVVITFAHLFMIEVVISSMPYDGLSFRFFMHFRTSFSETGKRTIDDFIT
jgi:hypothetical protein